MADTSVRSQVLNFVIYSKREAEELGNLREAEGGATTSPSKEHLKAFGHLTKMPPGHLLCEETMFLMDEQMMDVWMDLIQFYF